MDWEDLVEEGKETHSITLPGESHGQRSLVGYSPSGHTEPDMMKQLSMHSHTPRNGLVGPHGNPIFSFLRNLHTVLHSGCKTYLPISNVGLFPFLHNLSSICYVKIFFLEVIFLLLFHTKFILTGWKRAHIFLFLLNVSGPVWDPPEEQGAPGVMGRLAGLSLSCVGLALHAHCWPQKVVPTLSTM